jgi:TorA maturation chaperone TorD
MRPSSEIADANGDSGRARQRSLTYGLLACFFRREPDRELAQYLRNPGVFPHLVEAGMDLDPEELLAPPLHRVADTLADDYSALFVSPAERIVLNESVHRPEEGALMGKATVLVKELIRSLGLILDEGWTDLPDHLSVELEIMQDLADTEADTIGRNDTGLVAECRARQVAFLRDHLGKWVPGVCDEMRARAKTSFYRELARLTKSFILEEMGLADSAPSSSSGWKAQKSRIQEWG